MFLCDPRLKHLRVSKLCLIRQICKFGNVLEMMRRLIRSDSVRSSFERSEKIDKLIIGLPNNKNKTCIIIK